MTEGKKDTLVSKHARAVNAAWRVGACMSAIFDVHVQPHVMTEEASGTVHAVERSGCMLHQFHTTAQG